MTHRTIETQRKGDPREKILCVSVVEIDDPLAPARGVVLAVLSGLFAWGLIGLALWSAP